MKKFRSYWFVWYGFMNGGEGNLATLCHTNFFPVNEAKNIIRGILEEKNPGISIGTIIIRNFIRIPEDSYNEYYTKDAD